MLRWSQIKLLLATFLVLFIATIMNANNRTEIRHTSPENPTIKRRILNGAPMGNVVYGTARKAERTSSLVRDAVRAGFRHIATAANHKLHNEPGVGEGWSLAATKSGYLERKDFFLQTAFVPRNSNDWKNRNDVDENLGIEEQVRHSIRSSLVNLKTDYLDAVIYHNFDNKLQSFDEMMRAWKVLEAFVDRGLIRFLGINNCHDKNYIKRLVEESNIKPSIVQNRFHQNHGFDATLRPFLKRHDIAFQGFGILTEKDDALQKPLIKMMVKRKRLAPQNVVHAFVLSLGITPMTGTENRKHMIENYEIGRRYNAGEVFFRFMSGMDDDRRKIAQALGSKLKDLKFD